jgi:hypothetical protein
MSATSTVKSAYSVMLLESLTETLAANVPWCA